jgi:imidazolonepropionase-like amidohydrolase
MGADNMKRMADRQVFWVPTVFTMKAYSMHMPLDSIEAEISSKNLDHQLEQIALARRSGVPIAAGTDAGGVGVRHGRAFAEELKLIMQAGFSPEEAIRCATFEGARLLGLDNELGRLVKGMPANFVVIEGPPTDMPESLKKVRAVYVRGKRVAGYELRVRS